MGALSGGINLGAPILPATEEDIFPTHDAQYGKGGYRAVQYTTGPTNSRDSIPFERRSIGMVVRTLDTNKNWVLTVNDAVNPEWTEETVSLDGGSF
jgi:hypothetical protein